MEAPRPESAKARLPTASAGRREQPAASARSGLVAVAVLVLVVVLLGSAATPPAAEAGISIPNPIHVIGSGIGSLLGGAAGPIASLAVKAFEAIIQHLFAPIAKLVTVALIGWLTAIPNFAQGNVAHLEQTVAAICGGVLGAVATLSVIRYWLAGFASGGDSGFSALEGLVRTIGAALFIAIWPSLFERAIGLTNLLSGAVLSSGITEKEAAKLVEAGLGGAIAVGATSGFTAGFGLFLTIAIAVAASLLFLGLLLLKIVVSMSTILLFVGMPFAAVLWPIAPWIGRLVGRAFAVCLAVPVLWALCFAAAAALSADTLTLNQLTGSANGVLNTLLSPLVAIVLLYVMVRLPLHLSRMAMLGGVSLGGGFVGRAVSYAAGSQLRDTARQHLPASLGGRSSEQQSESGLGRELRTAATAAGIAGTGGTAAGAAAVSRGASARTGATSAVTGAVPATGAKTTNGAGGYKPPPLAQAKASGQALQTGLKNVPFDEEHRARFDDEMEQAQASADANPVTVGEARAALTELPRETHQSIGGLAAKYGNDGEKTRRVLAHQATSDGWSDGERDALRTLAAATPDVRGQALQHAKVDHSIVNGPGGSVGEPAAASARGGVGGKSGGDGSGGPPATFEGQSSDPRPVSDSWGGGGRGSAGEGGPGGTPPGTPETSDVADRDPGWKDPAGGQRATPGGTSGTSAPPPQPERASLRPAPEPRDESPGN
jgi:hypothetical protein